MRAALVDGARHAPLAGAAAAEEDDLLVSSLTSTFKHEWSVSRGALPPRSAPPARGGRAAEDDASVAGVR